MKKKLLSIFTVLLAVALLAGLVGCGGATSSSSAAPASASAAASSAAPSEPAANGAASDWQYIKDKGELIIGITYFEPMNFLDSSGKLTGFETEFATAVCDILGVTPQFQEINWSAKETELNARNIDCIWNGLTITPERQQNMSISQPYMQNMQVLVVKSANAAEAAKSVDGLTITAEIGSAGEEVVQSEAFFGKATYVGVDTQAKALLEVASGTADGCVIDYVTSIGMIGEGTDYADLVAVEAQAFGEEEYGVALRKDDTELTQKINDAINQMLADGSLKEIADRYKLGNLLITG